MSSKMKFSGILMAEYLFVKITKTHPQRDIYIYIYIERER